jgi:tetratricopeptide (TPR) repeat protein
MPEVAPLVLTDALGPKPTVVSMSAVMSTVADALSQQYANADTATARRIFAASEGLLKLADDSEYRARLKPSASQLRQLMASVELRSGEVDAARPLLEQALSAEPTVWGYTMLATLERQVGNVDRALAHATKAAELPAAKVLQLDAADAKLLAFEILRDRGEVPRAEAALEDALGMVLRMRKRRITPEAEVRAERLLARVFDGYGEQQRATRALQRALEIADSNRQILGPTVLGAVGRALVQKDIASARAALQLGIKAGVDGDDLVYGALWLMLLETELGETPDGKVDRILLDAITGESWTSTLARWARRMTSDEELRSEANTYSEQIEAEFYISMRARAAGAQSGEQKLESVAKNPLIDLMEVQIARDLLAPKTHAKLPGKYELP